MSAENLIIGITMTITWKWGGNDRKNRIYYEKLKNKEPTGFLYERYNKGITNKVDKPSLAIELSAEDHIVSLTDEIRSSINYLQNDDNYGENCDTKLILQHWASSFEYRISKKYKTAAEAIDDWLPLQKLDGYIMVDIDFKRKYGEENADSFSAQWENFSCRNHHVIVEGIRDAKVKKSVLAAQSENDLNIKNGTLIMALHHLAYMVPSKVSINNTTWTPSIPNSKDSFLIIVKNSNEIDKHVRSHKKICEMKNIKDHPIVFEIQTKEERTYIIVIAHARYECESIIEAIDMAFKIYVMFQIPFPPQCAKIWLFLNELFYKLPLEQQPNAKITSIINSYKM